MAYGGFRSALFGLVAVAAGSLLGATAHADDVMAPRYGNTTIAMDATGLETRYYYAADGTLTGRVGDTKFNGTWKVEGDKLCMSTEPPQPGQPNPTCVPVTVHKLGDTWTANGRTVKLVQGIQ
jgi:hypothetical protein